MAIRKNSVPWHNNCRYYVNVTFPVTYENNSNYDNTPASAIETAILNLLNLPWIIGGIRSAMHFVKMRYLIRMTHYFIA